MNERIRELALESGFQYESYKDIWYLEGLNPSCDSEFQRFAELIVKRCGQVLVDNTPVVNLVEDWDKGYDRAMNDCIHYIYEHFGVEE